LNSLGEDDLINIRYKDISLNIKERWKVSLSLYLLLLEEVLVVGEVRVDPSAISKIYNWDGQTVLSAHRLF
jgi:hypothetical protein